TRRTLLATGLAAALARPARAAEPLAFGELYRNAGLMGLEFSDKAKALDGRPVTIAGFMAPMLKVQADFVVLTREPVTVCPFCQSSADWPADLVVVYLAGSQPYVGNEVPIAVTGTLELGEYTDPGSEFVSMVRVRDARYVEV
ncbi:MAG TPA: hypothetical protein VEH84_03140, partial [Alphaproteobacteria bacterium]|nr:hypothetical protein [Alphaproteobacteria bacterium]